MRLDLALWESLATLNELWVGIQPASPVPACKGNATSGIVDWGAAERVCFLLFDPFLELFYIVNKIFIPVCGF